MTFYDVAKNAVKALVSVAFRYRVVGAERVPASGGIIIAANHVSNLDPPLVGISLRRPVSYMAKKELFAMPVLGALIRRLNAFPVDRQAGGTAALRASLRMLKEGHAVVVFPEGGRNVRGDKESKGGAAFLAAASGVPVVPAAIVGSGRLRPFAPLRVVFGDPFHVVRDRKAEGDDLEKWTAEIMGRIRALQENTR